MKISYNWLKEYLPQNQMVKMPDCPQKMGEILTSVGLEVEGIEKYEEVVNNLEGIIKDIDNLLIMSVNPGFGGQKFIEHTYQKIELARKLIERFSAATKIEVDGGVNSINAPKLLSAGADILVSGSFIFESANPSETISDLKGISWTINAG